MQSPDPVLTASLFCNRRLDAAVHGAVAPALRALRAADPGTPWALWWVRYSRTGDHLKLRLHGPESGRELARRALSDAAEAFFASLPPADPAEARITRPGVPSIDEDDETPGEYPDRSLRWSRYRRSYVSFGARELLDDDAFVARMTACLAAGAELVLESTALDDKGTIPGGARQRTLLKAVLGGLAASGFDAEQRLAYLEYHRGWLLRFALNDSEKDAEAVATFDRQLAAPTVQQVRRVAAAQWSAAPAPRPDMAEGRWGDAVASLAEYAASLRGRPELGDPYSDDPAFLAVFKAMHGVANQVGLGMLQEAFVHHLVLRAVSPGDEAAPAPAEPVAAAVGA